MRRLIGSALVGAIIASLTLAPASAGQFTSSPATPLGSTMSSGGMTPIPQHGPVYLDPANMRPPEARPSQGADVPATGGGESGIDLVVGGSVKTSPDGLSCYFQGQFGPNTPEMWIKNLGDHVMPAGTVIIIKLSNGKTGKLVLKSDLKPGYAVGSTLDFPVPEGVELDCSAKVQV